MNAVTFLILAAFVVLFVATFVTYLRRRDALSRDVMLIFASVAALFAIVGLRAVLGEVPRAVTAVGVAILLAQPLFTLRVVHRIRRVPAWLWMLAAAGYLATAVPLSVTSDPPRALSVAAALVFAATDIVAATLLALEAAKRVGAARVRLYCAAGASAALALGLLVLSLFQQNPVSEVLGRFLALAAVSLYLLAFLPSRWLRRLWSAVATYAFTNKLVDAPTTETAVELWQRTAELARRTTGARAALVVSGDAGEVLASASDAPLPATIGNPIGPLPGARDGSRALRSDGGTLGSIAHELRAPFVMVVPFYASAEQGALVLLRERPSLFGNDDGEIVASLARHAAVFAERSAALEQHAALAERLAQTVAALEQASQAKSDFLASMSHELRTPLSAIIGFAALMRDEPLHGDHRSVPDEWIQHVHRSGDHLLALINDVLDLTKIEAGRIELQRERFDLAAALAESVEGLRPLADRKQIRITVTAEPGTIEADRGRTRQILYNLLSNAIKFTPDGGQVDVEATYSGSDVTISVADTGVGIAAEDLERVFEEFSQVGDIKAREAGTGLGLALTRRLAEAHGGGISVSSEPGRGSRFEVSLPGSHVESDPEASPATDGMPALPFAAGSAEAATILLIEDDPGAVRLLRTYLEGEGYDVFVAASGEAGIEIARAATPAAILLDVLLPGIDGWEVLRRLKADAALRDIPVMVVTVVDERNVAMTLGAVDYFLKPVDPQALLRRLAQYTFTTKVKQRRVRVLAVDDDPAARALIVNTLAVEGFDIVAAASGADAIDLAADDPPELVICDLVMPDMDGYEVVNQLRSSDATRDATILILTGHELTSADRDRLNGKVAGILNKGEDLRGPLVAWLDRAAAAARRRQTTTPTAP